MKQRVGIARALEHRAAISLMDEPFGALDPMIRELMQIELLKLLGDESRTIVFVTHSIEEAIFLSDRIVIFGTRPGRILDIVEVSLPKPRWIDDEKIKASGILRRLSPADMAPLEGRIAARQPARLTRFALGSGPAACDAAGPDRSGPALSWVAGP